MTELTNYILESNEPRLDRENANRAADYHKVSAYREQCIALTGSDMMPPVLYKGRMIEAGRLGSRKLSDR